MNKLREVKDDLLKEWIEFREETAFCEMTPQDKKYYRNGFADVIELLYL